MGQLRKGFDCTTCGENTPFSAYVYAHWGILLTHTCECGAQHSIYKGRAKQTRRGKKPKARKQAA
jgi:transcription elongation factor Elf1